MVFFHIHQDKTRNSRNHQITITEQNNKIMNAPRRTKTVTNKKKQRNAMEACARAKEWAEKRAAAKKDMITPPRKENKNTLDTYFSPVAAVRVAASPFAIKARPVTTLLMTQEDEEGDNDMKMDEEEEVYTTTSNTKKKNNHDESFHDAQEDMIDFCGDHPETKQEVTDRLRRLMEVEMKKIQHFWEEYIYSHYRYIGLEEQLNNILNDDKKRNV